MPILNREKIRNLIDDGELVLYPLRNQDGSAAVEAASYDLRAGIVLLKNRNNGDLETFRFDEDADAQPVVTLHPGQMIFVITHEELKLTTGISGTVYSRNRLQKENILALNAGHVDPGYEGPIIIRLINLGSQEWALSMGEPVFTVVFHTVEPSKEDDKPGDKRTKEQTLAAAQTTALHAFSNPFHDLYKAEITKQLHEHYTKAENDLRKTLAKDFFQRDDVEKFAFRFGAAVVAGVVILSRIPWDRVWQFIKWGIRIP